MSLATANRTALYRVRELVWGVTPTNPALIETRYTGESLDANISFEKSKEIRADRQLSDTVLVDSSPSGAVNIEMSYTSFEDLIEAALMGTWSASLAIVGVAGDISTTTTPTSNLTSTLGTKFNNVVVGQWILLTGFTDPLINNQLFLVTGKADNSHLTLSPIPNSAETPAAAAAHVDGKMLRNGITERSYTLVKQLNDATVMTRHIFTGMRVKGMSLQMQTKAILTGAFNFIGKDDQLSEATFAGESITAAATTEVLNCVASIRNVTQDNAVFGTKGSIMSLSMELDNQHREQKGLAVLGNIGVVAGQLSVNFNASQYFQDKTQALKFKTAAVFSFSFVLADSLGNTLVFTAPRCKYEKFTFNSTGLDTDVMADTSFTALRDPTTNCMIQIDAFPAA